jgi:TPR repeat protein
LKRGKYLLQQLDPIERKEAFECFEQARKLGSSEALGLVAECLYYGGKAFGTIEDKFRAVKLAQQGLELHPAEPLCFAVLGSCYRFGVGGLELNLVRAVSLLLRGVDMMCGSAINRLGAYFDSHVQDINTSASLYSRGAELGHPWCTYNLAVYYHLKRKPPQLARAFELYNRAVAMGHLYAMLNLAELYQVFLSIRLLSDIFRDVLFTRYSLSFIVLVYFHRANLSHLIFNPRINC